MSLETIPKLLHSSKTKCTCLRCHRCHHKTIFVRLQKRNAFAWSHSSFLLPRDCFFMMQTHTVRIHHVFYPFDAHDVHSDIPYVLDFTHAWPKRVCACRAVCEEISCICCAVMLCSCACGCLCEEGLLDVGLLYTSFMLVWLEWLELASAFAAWITPAHSDSHFQRHSDSENTARTGNVCCMCPYQCIGTCTQHGLYVNVCVLVLEHDMSKCAHDYWHTERNAPTTQRPITPTSPHTLWIHVKQRSREAEESYEQESEEEEEAKEDENDDGELKIKPMSLSSDARRGFCGAIKLDRGFWSVCMGSLFVFY